jgi:phosphohistidine phosphatase SixA
MRHAVQQWRRAAAFCGFVAVMGLAQPGAAAPASPALPELGSVLAELRKGGLVIFLRHTSTDRRARRDEAKDITQCDTQRNLNAAGREQATQIGAAFVALRIPVGTVTSSPYCRCKDTALLAFGHFTVSEALHFAVGVDEDESKRFTESLRRMLSTPPEAGTNSVVVAHMSNFREATGIWPKAEGVAYVFRPLGDGNYKVIAMILAPDWGKAARAETSHKDRTAIQIPGAGA